MVRVTALILFALCLSGCKFGATLDPFYQAVLRGQPRNPGAIYLQGQHLLTQGQYERAAAYFNRLTQVTPDDPAGWIGLGQAELELEHPRRAERAFRRALSIGNKPMPDAEFGLASALIFQGKLEPAREQIDKIEKERGVSASSLRLRGDWAFMARQYDQALHYFEQSLSQLGTQPDLQQRVEGLNKYLGSRAK
ncbi:tetratricopeptide repeat protein [bacterium]|nr:tetratricopeptide repeat protein [bacterium]